MSNMNADTTVKMLQELAAEWADLFEKAGEQPPLNICFHATATNLLTVNGITLGSVSDIDAASATYDVEFLYIPKTDGSHYEIYLSCPGSGPHEIGYIHLITPVYSAAPQITA